MQKGVVGGVLYLNSMVEKFRKKIGKKFLCGTGWD
jgi:hypothetical protein